MCQVTITLVFNNNLTLDWLQSFLCVEFCDIGFLLDDRFRPSLKLYPGGGNDYINAVIVAVSIRMSIFIGNSLMSLRRINYLIFLLQGNNDRLNYILSQSPLKETVVDLWRLVNDYNSSTIVMLNQISTDQV